MHDVDLEVQRTFPLFSLILPTFHDASKMERVELEHPNTVDKGGDKKAAAGNVLMITAISFIRQATTTKSVTKHYCSSNATFSSPRAWAAVCTNVFTYMCM